MDTGMRAHLLLFPPDDEEGLNVVVCQELLPLPSAPLLHLVGVAQVLQRRLGDVHTTEKWAHIRTCTSRNN